MINIAVASTLAVSSLAFAPASADLAVFGGSVRHHSPDKGYDAPLIVMCDDGLVRQVPEGKHSDDNDICVDEDVDKIKVRENEEWWVEGVNGVWSKRYDKAGWYEFSNITNGKYVVTRD